MRLPTVAEFELHLPCDSVDGCGITIVGSRGSGIAIRALLPGGTAEKDGRLQVGDKLVAVDGRQAILMTCAQVARCLRQDKVIALIVDRPDYDLIDHQIYYGNRIHTNSLMKSSWSSSFSSASERDCDTGFDSATSTQPSPDLVSSVTEVEFLTPSPEPAPLTVAAATTAAAVASTASANILCTKQLENSLYVPPSSAGSLKFCYPAMNKIKKMINTHVLPKNSTNSGESGIDLKVYSVGKYKPFHDTQSVTSSLDTESSFDMHNLVFSDGVDSCDELISSSYRF